jgi:hypothetical protein
MSHRPISWPTKRLLMAEVLNETDEEAGNSRDGQSSPGGETPATLESALDSVRQGYEPYADFPAAFVAEELKLLIRHHGPKLPAGELLTDRDWKAHERCNSSGPGEPPLEVQVDYDLADFLRQMADCNGIDLDRYANHLLEGAVLAEGGVGEMILNKSQVIGGVGVEAGTRVDSSQHHGSVGEEGRFFKRHVRVKVGGKTVEGVVDLADLLKSEDAEQDRETLVQRARTALAGLNVVVHPLALQEGDVGCGMLRVACEWGDEATFKQAKKRLKRAGLVAYPVKEHPGVLHVRA